MWMCVYLLIKGDGSRVDTNVTPVVGEDVDMVCVCVYPCGVVAVWREGCKCRPARAEGVWALARVLGIKAVHRGRG